MILAKTPLPLQIRPGVALQSWFDFSDTSSIQASGNDVVSVLNKAGNGNNLSQSVIANRPKTGIITQNGLNVISFNASSVQFLNFANNTPASVPFTVFVVGKSDGNVNAIQAFIGRQTSNTPGQWVLRREISFGLFNTFAFGAGGSSASTNPASEVGNIHSVAFANNSAISYRMNGTLSSSNPAVRDGYDNNITTGLVLGASNPAGGGAQY